MSELASQTQPLADFLMRRFIGTMCLAAGREAQVGMRYRWQLSGDFEGSWVMSLVPGEVGVHADDGCEVNGTVSWDLSLVDANNFVRGQYGFRAALGDGRFRVDAPRAALMLFAKAITSFSKVDLARAFREPKDYANESFSKEAQAQNRPRTAGGVQLRPMQH